MSSTEFDKFSARYPNVISVISDTEYGFAGTVFRDANGQLTVALRGTAGAADLLADVGLTIYGAAYQQILDMYNWWQQETAAAGQTIYKYSIKWSSTAPAGSVLQMEGNRVGPGAHPQTQFQWLVRSAIVTTQQGDLYGQADIHSVQVAGHSLGGHLASAFTALFSSQVEQTFTYNAPGFKNTDANKAFFAALEGVPPANVIMPSDVAGKVTRIQANDATPGEDQIEAISNLHGGTPGTLKQVAIEDRGFWAGDIGTGNHSIVNVTDSLAIYSLLGKMDSTLTVDTFNTLFQSASNQMDSTREHLVDSIQLLLTGNPDPLPVGDNYRDNLYQAIYAIHDLINTKGLAGNVRVRPSNSITPWTADANFSAFLSLYYLSPVYLSGAGISEDVMPNANPLLYTDWRNGKYDGPYIEDRIVALSALLGNHILDNTNNDPEDGEIIYYDYATNREIFSGGGNDEINPSDDTDHAQVHFGSSGIDIMEGGEQSDRFYGGAGNDTYVFEMSSGGDVIGMDTIMDFQGANTLRLGGINLGTLKPISTGSNIYKGDDEDVRVILNGSTLRVVRALTKEIITIEGFNKTGNNFGLNFGDVDKPAAPRTSGLYEVGDGILGQYDPDDEKDDDEFDVYLPPSRGTLNNENYVEQNEDLDWEQYRQIAMYYVATDYPESNSAFQGSLAGDVLVGSGSASSLKGQDGNDYLYGDSFDADNMSSGMADLLIGGRGDDTLYGGGGNDTLYGADQYISSSAAISDEDYRIFLGWNFSSGTLGASVKAGKTTIEAANESNYLDGGDGNDNLYGASYRDRIIGGLGEDRVYGGAGQDLVSGGDNNDQIWGDSYWLQGNGSAAVGDFIAPDKIPSGSDYKRAYFYQSGHNLSQILDMNLDYNDTIDAGEGDDVVLGEIGSDVISGGGGADTLFGDRSYNTGYFSSSSYDPGRQKLSAAYHGNDVIDGGDGNDGIIGGGGDDMLFGGDDSILSSWDGSSGNANGNINGNMNDRIFGDLGIAMYESVMSGTGETAVNASHEQWWGNDVIYGGKGNDYLLGEGGEDVIYGGDNNDFIAGDWTTAGQRISQVDIDRYGLADKLYGGGGKDTLRGGGGDDWLEGGDGDDGLVGDGGDDMILGGKGNDVLDGGAGDDTYIYYGGISSDTIGDEKDTILDALDNNTLKLVDTYLTDEGKAWVYSGSTNISIYTDYNGSQYIRMTHEVYKSFSGRIQDISGNALELEHMENSNSNATNSLYLLADVNYVINTTGNTNVSIKTTNNLSDVTFNDTNRVDVIMDGDKATLMVRRSDGKTMPLMISNWAALSNLLDTSSNKAGFNINLSGNIYDGVTISGRGGNDVIRGGIANEIFNGGTGNDTFAFEEGHGMDKITSSEAGDIILVDTDPANVYVTRDGSDYLIRYKDNSGDSIRIDKGTLNGAVNTLKFSVSGEVWTLNNSINLKKQQIFTINVGDSHAANDPDPESVDGVVFFSMDDFVLNNNNLPSGDWRIVDARPLSGFNTESVQFAFGFHNNKAAMMFLPQASGHAEIEYFIQGVNGGAIYRGIMDVNFDSDTTLAGSNTADYLDGVDADSVVIDGGTGHDRIMGSHGVDTVIHRVGDGNDDLQMSGGAFNDVLVLMGNGTTTASDLGFEQDRFDLKVHLHGETITVRDYFHVAGGIWTRYGEIGEIRLYKSESDYRNKQNPIGIWTPDTADTVSGIYALRSNLLEMAGTANNDVITAINTGDGNNILRGAAGNDTLTGGGGSDTYQFAGGDGVDIIHNIDPEAVQTDRDVLDISGVDYRNIWLYQNGDDLVVKILGSADQVAVKDWYGVDDNSQDENELDLIQASGGGNIKQLFNDQASINISTDTFDNLVQAMASFGAAPAATGWYNRANLSGEEQTLLAAINNTWT